MNSRSLALAALSGAALLAACQRQEEGYDPRVDGVAPRVAYLDTDPASGTPYILQDPKTHLPRPGSAGTVAPPAAPVRPGAAPLPETGPASAPEIPIVAPLTAPPPPPPPDIGG